MKLFKQIPELNDRQVVVNVALIIRSTEYDGKVINLRGWRPKEIKAQERAAGVSD